MKIMGYSRIQLILSNMQDSKRRGSLRDRGSGFLQLQQLSLELWFIPLCPHYSTWVESMYR